MGFVHQAVTDTAGHLAARQAWQYIAGGGVPNPPAQAPPGLSKPVNTILGWGKWGVLVCGVAGLLICGGKMAMATATGPRSPRMAPPGFPGCSPASAWLRSPRRSWGCSCDPRDPYPAPWSSGRGGSGCRPRPAGWPSRYRLARRASSRAAADRRCPPASAVPRALRARISPGCRR